MRMHADQVDVTVADARRLLPAELADRPVRPVASVWVRGDLLPGNLLLRDGKLVGLIDFAEAGVGDPACDLMVFWHVLGPSGRAQVHVGWGWTTTPGTGARRGRSRRRWSLCPITGTPTRT